MPFRYPRGGVLQPKGYIRIKHRGEWRDKLEHRVIWQLTNSVLYIPTHYEIHHINHIPWDNTPSNLVMLPRPEHAELSNIYWGSGGSRITLEDFTEEWYVKLTARGVRIPEQLMMDYSFSWYEKYRKVPF